jgi:hypothetical protein
MFTTALSESSRPVRLLRIYFETKEMEDSSQARCDLSRANDIIAIDGYDPLRSTEISNGPCKGPKDQRFELEGETVPHRGEHFRSMYEPVRLLGQVFITNENVMTPDIVKQFPPTKRKERNHQLPTDCIGS